MAYAQSQELVGIEEEVADRLHHERMVQGWLDEMTMDSGGRLGQQYRIV